jgi:glycosyltransferase involved in cell wall biosynthesis
VPEIGRLDRGLENLPSMSRSLYICYFGVDQPLVRTQVIPYLVELIKDGHEISLLTFEPDVFGEGEDGKRKQEEIRRELAEQGIEWRWLRYHKRFSVLATAWDIFRGTLFIRRFIRDKRPDILHGRVHVPTLMGALARKLSSHKPKLLFDIRGFFPEEYTDAGVWPEGGWLYRAAKRVERWLLREADGFVVLTEKARAILFPESKNSGVDKLGRPVQVIPCCVDLARFSMANGARETIRAKLGISDRRVITYVGSFGGWYLTEEMLDLFAAGRERDASTFVMILTQRDKDKIVDKLLAKGFAPNDFYVGSVAAGELPNYLSAADVAVSFIKACYSKQSSSPTKIAEYLASGLPIISNRGVGDVDALFENNSIGALTGDFSIESYQTALAELEGLGDVSSKCRVVALEGFDLETIGGERYRQLYDRLLSNRNSHK